MSDIHARLKERGFRLPAPPKPNGNYLPFVRSGRQVLVAGQTSTSGGVLQYEGIVGVDLTVPQAQHAAALCALNALAIAGLACDGDFDRLRVLRLTGFVRCGSDFADTPLVMDGASELLVLALGERGRHVRAAVGVAALPRRSPVEIESTFEVDE
ncbi:RidA family protein [Streptomyces sp. NPDC056121]|uniref:RidA family protein n=1 Tax=Streptomyces TaxID=1883 RepID=UPI001D0B7D89|nr:MULTISPECIES: RidA family protein [Streptomyces]MCX5084312.1 RidA family protein [Streptomyces sp. NBC_00401]UDM04369.1 RidA family protein [Streptomyces longhuiensis]